MKKLIAFYILFIGICKVYGQQVSYVGDPDASYFNARELAFSGMHSIARDTLKRILTRYPEYTDVRSLLAKTYSWDANYGEARKHLNRITSAERSNKEAWIAAVKNEIYAKNHHIALGLTLKALLFLPEDGDLLQLKNSLSAKLHTGELQNSVGEGGPKEDSEDEKERKNQIALFNAFDVFDVVYEPMIYMGLDYTRNSKFGKIIPRINYANRFDTHGLQYESDLYPKISETFYGYVNYGFSDSEIFPKHRAGLELYANIKKGKEASLGVRYLDFLDTKTTILTGSFGLYKGNYYVSLRPYVTPNPTGSTGLSGTLTGRKYLKHKDHYLGLLLSAGFIPELRQFTVNNTLLSETLYFIDSQQLMFEYQFTGKSISNLYKAQLGITHQELVFEPGRFFWAVTAALKYHVKF